MELYVGYAERPPAGPDVDAPSQADASGAGSAHGVANGSLVAICGAPARQRGEEPWPPASGAVCPRCRDVVQGFVR